MFCSPKKDGEDDPASGLKRWPTTEQVLRATLGSDKFNTADSESKGTIVITGANTGIGRAAAKALASAGYGIVICSRNVAKGAAVVKEIEENGGRAFVQPLDLGKLESVKVAAKSIVERIAELKFPPLECLVLNAGIFPFGAKYAEDTKCEMTFQVNHLGHYLLTQLLLPELRKRKAAAGRSARVVAVSSGSHHGPLITSNVDNKEEVMEKVVMAKRAGFGAYGSSKLCNVLFANKLHRMESGNGIVACSLHPGAMIGTDIARQGNFLFRWSFRVINLFTKSVDQGAATTVFCSTCAPEHLQGRYFDECRPSPQNKIATQAAEDVLWEISSEIVAPFL